MSKQRLKDFLQKRKNEGHSWPTQNMFYHWSSSNYLGFRDACLSKVGKKLLIEVDRFDEWLDSVSDENSNPKDHE